MAKIEEDTEGFDLVISDWERDGEPARAGLQLLRRLRQAGKTLPVIYYHGGFDPKFRVVRARQAKEAGAFGEAVLPSELFALVAKALQS